MEWFCHEHLKGGLNSGTGHAELSEERSQGIKPDRLADVEGAPAILVAAETHQVLGRFRRVLPTFNVDDATRLARLPIRSGTHGVGG
jgi:hypothetical protein